jgi:hypothetical protein
VQLVHDRGVKDLPGTVIQDVDIPEKRGEVARVVREIPGHTLRTVRERRVGGPSSEYPHAVGSRQVSGDQLASNEAGAPRYGDLHGQK